MEKRRTPAQRRRLLQRRKVQIVPSPEYLEIMEILECGEFPSAELVDRFLVKDRTMAFIRARIVDWALWRTRQARPLRRLANDDTFSVELEAAHDTAVARMRARWAEQDRRHSGRDVTPEDARRLARKQ